MIISKFSMNEGFMPARIARSDSTKLPTTHSKGNKAMNLMMGQSQAELSFYERRIGLRKYDLLKQTRAEAASIAQDGLRGG